MVENQKYKVEAETAVAYAFEAQEVAERASQDARKQADQARMEAARSRDSIAELERLNKQLKKCREK